MPRINALLGLGTALGISLAGRTLAAQETGNVAPESAGMAPMVVTAKKLSGNELLRENRRLRVELAGYDRKIAYLERRLHTLKTVVTDSLQRDITTLHAVTDSTRARRRSLEEMVSAMEARTTRPQQATAFR